jgi:DNA helicase-2/ATP-dependent DNA helicase PcrA
VHQQRRYGDTHLYAPRTRFIPDALLARFTRSAHGAAIPVDAADEASERPARVDVAARLKAMWS